MLILVSSTILSAQPNSNKDIKNGSISGRVLDASLNEPLPYVNIVVKILNIVEIVFIRTVTI